MINKEEFLRIVESRYEAINALDDGRDFYDYEKGFAAIVQGMTGSCLKAALGRFLGTGVKKNSLAIRAYRNSLVTPL